MTACRTLLLIHASENGICALHYLQCLVGQVGHVALPLRGARGVRWRRRPNHRATGGRGGAGGRWRRAQGCADSGVHGLPSVDTSIPSRRYHTPFGRQPGASTGWLTRATTAPQSSHTCPATDRLPSATFSCRFFSPPLPFRRAWPPTAPCAGACRSVALPPQTAEPVVAAPSRVGQAPMGRNPPSWAGAHGAAGPAGGQP